MSSRRGSTAREMTLPPRSTYGQILLTQRTNYNGKLLNNSSDESKAGSNGKRRDNLRYSKCDENEEYQDIEVEELKVFDIEQSTIISKNIRQSKADDDMSVFDIVTARTNRLGSANHERSFKSDREYGLL